MNEKREQTTITKNREPLAALFKTQKRSFSYPPHWINCLHDFGCCTSKTMGEENIKLIEELIDMIDKLNKEWQLNETNNLNESD